MADGRPCYSSDIRMYRDLDSSFLRYLFDATSPVVESWLKRNPNEAN